MAALSIAVAAAVAAWLAILAAVVLPVPDAWFQRLRWVGAASIGVLGLTLAGLALPAATPALVFGGGAAGAMLWPDRRPSALRA